MKNVTAMTEFFNTSNTAEFLPPRRLFNNDSKVERNLENEVSFWAKLFTSYTQDNPKKKKSA